MRFVILSLFFYACFSQQTCTSTTCPQNSACVFSGLQRACCPFPLTCIPPCIVGTSPCPGLPNFCCPNGNQCTEDQFGQVSCGPPQPTSISQSNISTSSGSSSTTTTSTDLTVTSVTSDVVTTTIPPLPGSTSSGLSSSDASTTTPLAVPSASPGQIYNLTSDDPSIFYNNGPSSSDAWVPSNISVISTDPSCTDVDVVHSTTQVNASLTIPFIGSGISIRCVVSPQGGPFSVTIGNQTQAFTASSNSTQCGFGRSLSHLEFSILITRDAATSQTDVQNAVVLNEGGKFSFIGATVFNDPQGPVISSALDNRGGDVFRMLFVVPVFLICVLL